VRNLYHDQSFADRILALTPSEAQMDVMLRNRFTMAKLGWQPREVIAIPLGSPSRDPAP
jgi:hypothetical protein